MFVKMEFEELLHLFQSLSYARRKYPMSVTYTKYLQKLHTCKNYDKQKDEVELFKKFLVENQDIRSNAEETNCGAKGFVCEEFYTGKSGTIINMNNFLIDGHVDEFWRLLCRVDKALFPNGKPDTKSFAAEKSTDNILKLFQNNRVLADAFSQIEKADVKNIKNVGQLLESEAVKEIINKTCTSFSDGTYSLEDISSLTDVVSSVVDTLSTSDSLDESVKNSLSVVSDALGCMKNNKQFDVNRLLSVISSIDMSKTQ